MSFHVLVRDSGQTRVFVVVGAGIEKTRELVTYEVVGGFCIGFADSCAGFSTIAVFSELRTSVLLSKWLNKPARKE